MKLRSTPTRLALSWAAVAVLALTSVQQLNAQAAAGSLVGTVTDQGQAVVPGAAVEITNVATNIKNTTTTNANGSYRFENLLVGSYNIKVSKDGFTTALLHGINLALNQTVTSNVTLAVGAVSTVVEVADVAQAIDTTTAHVGATFESREAIDTPGASLPLGALNLALLSAGVANAGGIGLGDGPSVGGQRPRNNSFNIEGVNNDRRDTTGRNVAVPNEATQEFSVLQNQYSAEFGNGTGGQFNTVVRGGTNQFHGAAYEYFQNRNLNAIDQSVKRIGVTKNPRYDENTFGLAGGGPFVKDKLFFYGLWQYDAKGQAPPPGSPLVAPTAAGYSTLSSLSGISQTNLGVLKQYLPAASTQSRTVRVNNISIPVGLVQITPPSFINVQTYLGSIDYNPSTKDQLRGRFINEIHDGFDTSALAPLPSFFVSRPTTAKILSATELHTFSPSVLNEFRFGYQRYNDLIGDGGFKFPGLDTFPNLQIDDLNQVQLGPYITSPQSTVLNSYQLMNNVSWTKGRHTMKFGWEGRKFINTQNATQRSRGDYDYSTLEQYLRDISPDFAERNVGSAAYYGNAINNSLFANDQFRLRPNLTVNVGLRWDYQGVGFSDGDWARNAIANLPGVIEFRKPNSQLSAFSPRIGIAYSPGTSGNTSIRAGFGWTYDKIFDNFGVNNRPPQLSSTVDIPPGTPNFLQNGGIRPNAVGVAACNTAASCRAITSGHIPDQEIPYALAWNFGVQRVIAKDYTLEVRYLGTRGVHLFTQTRLNRIAPVTPSFNIPTFATMPSSATLAALPITLGDITAKSNFSPLYPGFNANMVEFASRGNSIYHGLAVEMTRRFTRNLLFKSAYTWSHNIDDSTADLFSTFLSPRRPQDFQNMRPERSSSFLDRRHRFTYNWVYDTPWFRSNANKVTHYALGGYTLSGTYTFESPQYATVQSGVDSNLNGDNAADRAIVNVNGTPGTGSGVTAVNRAGSTVPFNNSGIVAYVAINPSAQYWVAREGAWANGGRMTLPFGRINNWDVQIKKAFIFTEQRKLEFAAQFFNLLNHPQYVAGYINQVQFHSSNTTRANLFPNDPTFNHPDQQYNSNSRTMQLTARFQF